MFSEPKEFRADELQAIRALGDSHGGKLLATYIQQEVEGFVRGMLNVSADDAANVAYFQAGVQFGEKLHFLLTGEERDIMDKHNVEVRSSDG